VAAKQDNHLELTFKAVLLGVLLSALLGGANAYLGLKVGMTVSASIPAAVISMAILRFFKRSSILENNLVQTAASAGESLAAGVIFTLPALILLNYWQDFNYLETFAIAAVGGTMGVLFAVPLRRALVIESPLRFPEGVATAEVLRAGSEGGKDVAFLAKAGVAAALLKLGQTGFKLGTSSAGGAVRVGRALIGGGIEFSAALLGVGAIVGFNIAVLVFLGGALSWLVAIPIYTWFSGIPEGRATYETALSLWSTKIRYLGVGAMAVGGIWALLSLLRPLRDGIRASMKAYRLSLTQQAAPTERDLPVPYLAAGLAVCAALIFLVAATLLDPKALQLSTGRFVILLFCATVFGLFAGFLFSAVAGYMAGLVGSSNNPVSGVTVATVLASSLLLALFLGSPGAIDPNAPWWRTAPAAAILIGALVCCAAAISGDTMQDLKAGVLLGATPLYQQVLQLAGVWIAALVLPLVLSLLYHAYGLGGVFPREGMNPEEMLAAPQASLMQSVAQGVFQKDLPWAFVAAGAAVAVLVITIDQILAAKSSSFRTPVLAVAVGMYLPLELSVPIFAGGLISSLARRNQSAKPESDQSETRRTVLFASGLITGEALVGILLAVPFAVSQSTRVLALVPPSFTPVATALSAVSLAAVALWLYRTAAGSR